MCYGICKYERFWTGECRGPIDWFKPDAACQEACYDELFENENMEDDHDEEDC